MTIQTPTLAREGAMFRIAVPAFGLGPRQTQAVERRQNTLLRADIETLLEGSLGPADIPQFSLTKSERRQLARQRRVRDALYGAPPAL